MKFSVSLKQRKYIANNILYWGRENHADYPWRNTDNMFHALTAEIMLQRTNADQVVPVYNYFIRNFRNPQEYIEKKLPHLFESLGLVWRQKEFNKLVNILKNIPIPVNKKDLIALPGIGEYIASAYRSLHLQKRDTIVDSNVVRLYGRFFGFITHGETRRLNWFIDLAESITPAKAFRDFNYGIIDLTRALCTKKPDCINCPLKRKCYYYYKKKGRCL